MKRTTALFSVALGALFFGTLAVLTQLAYRLGIKPLPLLAWRFFLSAIVIGIAAYKRNPQAFKVPKTDIVRYWLLSWFGYGASSLAFFLALKHADSSVVSALLYTYPALVAIGVTIFFKEPFTLKKALSISIVAVGCVCVVGLLGGGTVHVDALGIVLSILSAVCYAAFNLMSQRWLPGRSSMTMMSFMFSFAAAAFIALALIVNGPHAFFGTADSNPQMWPIIAAIVIGPTVLAILIYMRGVRQLGASEAALVSTLEPLFTVVLAWMFLGQALSAVQMLGIVLILVGVVISALAKKAASPIPVVPVSDDEIALRRDDWVGPNGETTPDYAKPKPKQNFAARVKGRMAGENSEGDERSWGRVALRIGILIVIVLIVFQILALAGIGALMSMKAPDISLERIEERSSQTSIMYGADGSVIARFAGDENREPVSFSRIPRTVINATVAIEDRRFYEHGGVDPISIMRALKRNAEEGVVKQGGSTITQQLIKMLYTNSERTLARKIKEAIYATRVEMDNSKDAILESYLNMAYYGQGAYGIESAARVYFNTTVEKLTLTQAATLAGLVQSPSAYNAMSNPGPVKKRRNVVLKAMRSQQMISETEYRRAIAEPLNVTPGYRSTDTITSPYFVDYAKREAVRLIGEQAFSHGGLKIYTTLDPVVQKEAERAAQALNDAHDPEVALVSVRQKDGAVLALVGGRSWKDSQYNLAVQGKRQPGSAFKPFTLMAALEQGVSPEKTFETSAFQTPVKDGIWRVTNYAPVSSSSMTLRDATVYSVNTVYARLVMQVGASNVARLANKFGFSSTINADPAVALGGLTYGVSPLEMASAYATIGSGGKRVEPGAITKIVDRSGKTIYQRSVTTAQVVKPKVAQTTASILREAVKRGSGKAADVAEDAAGKTGTTQSYRDAWFCGWSHGVATAVWVGYPQGQVAMDNVHGTRVSGGSYPARIWGTYMKRAIAARPAQGFAIPDIDSIDIVTDDVNKPSSEAGRAPVVSAPNGGVVIPDNESEEGGE